MSFRNRILRRFLNTEASDSKISVDEKLKAGWRGIIYAAKCIPELGVYATVFSPIVIGCNHFANTKPRLDRVEREALEEYSRITRKVLFLDEHEEFTRHAEAGLRIRKENGELKLLIEGLKEQKKREE